MRNLKNVTVTLELNVPLYAACRTNFTISGLTGTATADNFGPVWRINHDSSKSYNASWITEYNSSKANCALANCSCSSSGVSTTRADSGDCGFSCTAIVQTCGPANWSR